MRARFIQHAGTRAVLRVLWGSAGLSPLHTVPCPKSSDGRGAHEANAHLADSAALNDEAVGGSEADHPREQWPSCCDLCGEAAPEGAHRYILRSHLYDTPSGKPEPGDVFFLRYHGAGDPCPWWDNCDGLHLHAILPGGHWWDIDSRASNCTLKGERTHRCWVRHGTPPDLHVDKAGHTCAAGAGSISVPGYHGFLHHGAFTSC
jgi:hypothetical protein